MTTEKPTTTRNLDGYDAPVIPWEKVRAGLEKGFSHSRWLATTNADGSPHVMPLGALWLDGAAYFTSSPKSVKSKNLDRDHAATIVASTPDFDLVIEGDASRVTDGAELEKVVAEYREGGWPAEVEAEALTAPFSAPSAGPPPWYLYKITPDTIYALGISAPYGATRFRF